MQSSEEENLNALEACAERINKIIEKCPQTSNNFELKMEVAFLSMQIKKIKFDKLTEQFLATSNMQLNEREDKSNSSSADSDSTMIKPVCKTILPEARSTCQIKKEKIDTYPDTNSNIEEKTNDLPSLEDYSNRDSDEPPALFVNEKSIDKLMAELLSLGDYHFYIAKSGRYFKKVQAETTEDYRVIEEYLVSTRRMFHNYDPVYYRTFRVVISGIHPDIDLWEIKNDIEDFGHVVLNIFKPRQKESDESNPVLNVDLLELENNKDILKLQTILCWEVDIVAQKRLKICTDCEKYNYDRDNVENRIWCNKCGDRLRIVYRDIQKK